MAHERLWALGLLLTSAVALSGCDGVVTTPTSRPGERVDRSTVQPAPASRVPRLSHDEWENSVRDLLRLPDLPGNSATFRADPASSGFIFDNQGSRLEVDQSLWLAYQTASEELAATVVSDPVLLDALLPPAAGEDLARATAFIREFGLRAHRRPLSDDEVAEYVGVYEAGDGLFDEHDAFHSGIRLVITAMLQSPMFLYRVEQSDEVVGDLISLDDWEIAQRLSYFLWSSMPDDELFAAAAAGRLSIPGELEAQARRMLMDPRAEEVVVHFHEQLFEVESWDPMEPSPSFYEGVDPRLGEYAQTEHDLFIREMVFNRDAGWRELLTDTDTFVNQELARIYGLSGTYGEEFELASLDPTQRRGVFTQVGFLGSNATSVHPDPIHRGVFLSRRIVCHAIAAPPDDVPPLPPVDGMSNRDTVEAHTQQPGTNCASCHATLINPFGFPFESFDAVGAYRTDDFGFEVDTAATPSIGYDQVRVGDALELAEALAEHQQVHECYAQHWVEFAFGRNAVPEDTALVSQLGAASHSGDYSVQDLIVDLVLSASFVNRSAEELP